MGGRLSVKTENLISGGTKLTLTARELSDISRQVMEISRDSTQTIIYAGEKRPSGEHEVSERRL